MTTPIDSTTALVTSSPTDRCIPRREDVEKRTGLGRAHIYSLMTAGQFPQARRIGLRAVGWNAAEIERWIAERLGTGVRR